MKEDSPKHNNKRINFNKILASILVIGILFAVFSKNITFEFKGISKSDNYHNSIQSRDSKNIQNISGRLRISPNNSWTNFYNTFKKPYSSIKIQTYDFTNGDLKLALKNNANKSSNIKIITENHKFQQFKDTFKDLQKFFLGYINIQIKSDQQMRTEYIHSKYEILDTGFIIQTANLTNSSFYNNREYFFISYDTGVLASLNTIFDKDREGKPILNSDIHPNLLVCNINCRTVIEKLLTQARSSILIQNQYITDKRIMGILKHKITSLSGSGEVRILLSDVSDNNYPVLYLGNNYTKIFKKNYLHAKMMLIDNKILLISSINLSSNSMDNNREIGILVTDPNIISEFKHQFEKDWKNSK